MPYTPQELSDRQDISDVLSAYCRAIDDNRPDDVIGLFTDECHYDYGGELGTFNTKEFAYKFFRSGTDKIYKRSAHYVSNLEVSFTGQNTAMSITYLAAWHEFHEAIENAWIYGRYVDTLVRTDTGWKINSRRVDTLGQDDWPREVTYIERNVLPPRVKA